MMPTDPIQAMEFAQSKGQARKEGKTGITFSDIAGMEATKTELQEVVEVGSWCMISRVLASVIMTLPTTLALASPLKLHSMTKPVGGDSVQLCFWRHSGSLAQSLLVRLGHCCGSSSCIGSAHALC